MYDVMMHVVRKAEIKVEAVQGKKAQGKRIKIESSKKRLLCKTLSCLFHVYN
jgi:hypothetical protein